MEIKILLDEVGQIECDRYILTDNNDVLLRFVSNKYKVDDLSLSVENGDKRVVARVKDFVFKLPKEFVVAGVLKCVVGVIQQERVVRSIVVEPITLASVCDSFAAFKAFAVLEEKLKVHEEKLKSYEREIEMLKHTIELLKDDIEKINVALEQ